METSTSRMPFMIPCTADMLHGVQYMRTGCAVSAGLLLVATIFLFMFANPFGWGLAALFLVAAVWIAFAHVDWKQFGYHPPEAHQHGPEDLGRGPDDDPMLK